MKAVVFDLDDTLLRDDLSISGYTVRVFRRLHETGYLVTAASGRAQLSMKPYVDQLGCVDTYISCNGAEIWNGRTHELLHQELFSAETGIEIARFAEEHNCYAQVYEGDRFYYSMHGIWADRYAASARLRGSYAGPLSTYIREPRNKILLIGDKEQIDVLYTEALNRFSDKASVTRSKPFYLEFNPPAATKGIALETAASFLEISPKDYIAFGDSLNDLSMLQKAGVSVAVSNAWDEIRQAADYVCNSNNQDGPAHFLHEYCLHGEMLL